MINFVSIKVLISLMDGKLHSALDLARENEVSTKTISRVITTLLEAGVGIESKLGRYGGYFLSPSFMPQIFNVNEKKLSQMLSLAEHTKELLCKQYTPLEETIINSTPKSKLKSVLCMSSKIILDSKPWGNHIIDSSRFDILYEACINSKIIEFDYTNYNQNTSHRSFSPYCMTLKNGSWYTYGQCNTTNKFKLFKLSRMNNIIVTNNNFTPIEINIKDKPWNNLENFIETEIIVQIKNHSIDEIKEWLNITNIIKTQGKTIAQAKVTVSDGLYHKLIEESDKIKLISPIDMVERLLQKCKQIENIYREEQLTI